MKIPVGVVNHQPGFWGHGTTGSTKTKLAGLFTQPLLLLIPNPPCGFQQIQCRYLASALIPSELARFLTDKNRYRRDR
jgi:hypothetical protein